MDGAPARPEGTFTTSWRAFARGHSVSLLVGGGILAALLWWTSREDGLLPVVFAAGFVVLAGLWEAARFAWLGVAEVQVHPDRLTARSRTGRQWLVMRGDVTAMHLDKRWTVRTADLTLRIRDLGFTFDDWQALVGALTAWKVQPDRPRPGVRQARGGAVFTVTRSWLPAVVGLLLASVGLGVAWLARADYADGSWTEVPMVVVGIPLVCLMVAAYQFRLASQAVTSAQFGPGALGVSRLLGRQMQIPYSEIRDVQGYWIDTTRTTLYMGQRDLDVLDAMLAERLPDGQISGLRWLRSMLWFQWPSLLAAAVGAVVVWWGVTAWTFRDPKMAEFAGALALAAYVGLLVLGVRVWAAWLLARLDAAPPPPPQ